MMRKELVQWMKDNDEIPPTLFTEEEFFNSFFEGTTKDYHYYVTHDIPSGPYQHLRYDKNIFKGDVLCLYSSGYLDVWAFELEQDAVVFLLYLS